MFVFLAGSRLRFPYVNYRGELSTRTVKLVGVDYGMNDWYPEDQWFLRCFDEDKQAHRSFALAKIDPRSIEVL